MPLDGLPCIITLEEQKGADLLGGGGLVSLLPERRTNGGCEIDQSRDACDARRDGPHDRISMRQRDPELFQRASV
jgi:hypothetical protein